MDERSLEKEMSLVPKWIDAFHYSLSAVKKNAYFAAATMLVINFFIAQFMASDRKIYLFFASPIMTVAQFFLHTYGRHLSRLSQAYIPRIIRMHSALKHFPEKSSQFFQLFSEGQVQQFTTKQKLFFFYLTPLMIPAMSLASLGVYTALQTYMGGLGITLLFVLAVFCIAGIFTRHQLNKTTKAVSSLPIGSFDDYTKRILETPKAI